MKKLVVIVLLGFIAILSSCKVSPHTIKKMREKYMDDQNYVALSGEIIEIEEKKIFLFFFLYYKKTIC